MRIISGTARGTKLYTLEGIETRPTLDRVKESLFNIINNRIHDTVILDLFSGSGSIGLECASRGAKEIHMCDISQKAIEIIEKNVTKTHCENKVSIYNCDYKECLKRVKDLKFDIIYLDPPYKTEYIENSLKIILDLNIKKDDGIIIAETDDDKPLEKFIKNCNIKIYDKRKYGRAYLFFIK